MKLVGSLQITTPSDREIAMTRVFDAPRHLVYAAYTKPELLQRWFGVHNGWTLPVCEIDLRVGGAYRYVWRGPDGEEMGMGGTYTEIVPGETVAATEKFDESWYEGDADSRVDFTERDGKTTLTMTVRYATKAVRDAVLQSPMEQGVAAGFDVLEGILAKPA